MLEVDKMKVFAGGRDLDNTNSILLPTHTQTLSAGASLVMFPVPYVFVGVKIFGVRRRSTIPPPQHPPPPQYSFDYAPYKVGPAPHMEQSVFRAPARRFLPFLATQPDGMYGYGDTTSL